MVSCCGKGVLLDDCGLLQRHLLHRRRQLRHGPGGRRERRQGGGGGGYAASRPWLLSHRCHRRWL
jgi:hypothetical protein